jgi:hypothetical protein
MASAGVVDSQSVPGAATVAADTRGHDAGKKVKGRKRHLVLNTTGLLIVVLVKAASVQDRDGSIRVLDRACLSSRRWSRSSATTGSRGVHALTARARARNLHRSPAPGLDPFDVAGKTLATTARRAFTVTIDNVAVDGSFPSAGDADGAAAWAEAVRAP